MIGGGGGEGSTAGGGGGEGAATGGGGGGGGGSGTGGGGENFGTGGGAEEISAGGAGGGAAAGVGVPVGIVAGAGPPFSALRPPFRRRCFDSPFCCAAGSGGIAGLGFGTILRSPSASVCITRSSRSFDTNGFAIVATTFSYWFAVAAICARCPDIMMIGMGAVSSFASRRLHTSSPLISGRL